MDRQMNDDSRGLLIGATRGDRVALEALLAQHLPALRAFVRLRVGPLIRSKESSCDIVQSVCREVLQDLGTFRYQSEAAFKQWLYERTLHKVLDRHRYYRAAKRSPSREVAIGSGEGSSPGDDELSQHYATVRTPSRIAMAREELERIEAAFDLLPDDYREVITLARIIGLSHAEIAEKMDRSEASIRNLLHRALARLSGHLVRGT